MRFAFLLMPALIVGCTSLAPGSKDISFEEFRLCREFAAFAEAGGDINRPSPATSYTPLRDALNNGHEHLALMLIDRGARFDIDEGSGLTAFHVAVGRDYVEIVRIMLGKGANPNAPAGDATLLALVTGQSKIEILKLLLAHRADPNKVPYIERRASNDGPKAARLPPDWPETAAYPPLWIAASSGDPEAARLLLDAGARDELGMSTSPIEVAVIKGNPQMVELLLNRGARADAKLRNTEWWNHATLLHAAAAKGKLRIVQLLVEKGADVNAKDGAGKTPLQSAEDAKLGPSPIEESEVAVIVGVDGSTKKKPEPPARPPPDAAHKAVIDYLRAHGAK
jgi:ankyrin repeat protein